MMMNLPAQVAADRICETAHRCTDNDHDRHTDRRDGHPRNGNDSIRDDASPSGDEKDGRQKPTS
jgi:hypothetical protein